MPNILTLFFIFELISLNRFSNDNLQHAVAHGKRFFFALFYCKKLALSTKTIQNEFFQERLKMPSCYIAGRIEELPSRSRGLFEDGALCATLKGYKAVQTYDFFDETKFSQLNVLFLRACVKDLIECEAIMLLPEWQKSKTARILAAIAHLMGMDFIKFETPKIYN